MLCVEQFPRVVVVVNTVERSIFGSPKYFGNAKILRVHLLCELLCVTRRTIWAQIGLVLFQIEWTFTWGHLTMPWMPLNSMAPCKRNFGSPNETLEVRTKHWKIQYIIKCADSIWRPPIHCMSHWVGNSEFPILVCFSSRVVAKNSNRLLQWTWLCTRASKSLRTPIGWTVFKLLNFCRQYCFLKITFFENFQSSKHRELNCERPSKRMRVKYCRFADPSRRIEVEIVFPRPAARPP
jgi:hypothetical protein